MQDLVTSSFVILVIVAHICIGEFVLSTHRYLGPLIRCLNRVSLFLQILAGQSGSPTASPMDCLANGLPIYCWTKCQCVILSVMAYTGDLRSGYLFLGFPDYWRAPGTWSHLHVHRTPERAGGQKNIHLFKNMNYQSVHITSLNEIESIL